jgi:DMSO reductase anchor subunit
LILMLVLTQAGIGGFVAATLNPGSRGWMGMVALVWFLAGLAASVFHLGRPAKAWRIWLGWRTSWLSREAIALNLCLGLSAFAIVVPISGVAPAWRWVAVASGVLALMTQAMVYADTHRMFWKFTRTVTKFFGTSIVLGLAFALLGNPVASLAAVLLAATCVKLGFELSVLKHADADDGAWTELRRTAVLQRGLMRPVLGLRLCFGIGGGILLPFLVMAGIAPRACADMAFVLCVLGEFAERYLFFTTVAPDRMP